MKDQPLVSIITPCYNGEKYLKHFLDSLLVQYYNWVEFFFVNDGSTDETEEIFLSYKPQLEQKGWRVIYYKQNNRGQAHALNYGLKRFSGKYLACPDSDDILYPDFISAKVEFMESNPQYALCCCGVDFAKDRDISKITFSAQRVPKDNDNLFVDVLLGRRLAIVAPALTYFYRAECWLSVYPNRQIYDKTPVGQNWQMLLPVIYKGKCGYIHRKLARYIQRENSHNHIKRKLPLEKQIEMEQNLLFRILDDMNVPSQELTKYTKMIRRRYRRKLLANKLQKFPWLFAILQFLYRAKKVLVKAK